MSEPDDRLPEAILRTWPKATMDYAESYRWLEAQDYDRDTVKGATIERDLGQRTMNRQAFLRWVAGGSPDVQLALERLMAHKDSLVLLERMLARRTLEAQVDEPRPVDKEILVLLERTIAIWGALEEQVEPGRVEPRPVWPWLVWGGVAAGVLYWLLR